jgi:hypothetical protein
MPDKKRCISEHVPQLNDHDGGANGSRQVLKLRLVLIIISPSGDTTVPRRTKGADVHPAPVFAAGPSVAAAIQVTS